MSCAGYHFAGLIDLFKAENRNHKSFIEYSMHHIITMYLLIFSYLGNLIIGAPVLFIHNISDTMVALMRFFSDTDYQGVMPVLTISMVITWIYTRIFCFGVLIYEVIFSMEYFATYQWLHPIFGGLLISLYILHIFWTYLMLKIVYKFSQKGRLEDTVNNHEGDLQKKTQ
jgi:ceramide synthetase